MPMALSFLSESVLAEWIQPGAVVAAAVGGLGLLVSAFRHLETKLEKRIDKLETRIDEVKTELKAELKASEERQMAAVSDLKTDFKDLKTEFKASEDRQRGDLQLLRSEVKSLGDKMDSLLILLAKGAVAPTAGHGP